jgi:hypothetical protein
VTKLIERPASSESAAEASIITHFELRAWKDDSTSPAVCGAECDCGFTVDGFASLAAARDELGEHLGRPVVVHPSWCVPSLCDYRNRLAASGFHYGDLIELPSRAALADRLQVQMWQPACLHMGDSPEAATYVALTILDYQGKEQAHFDLTAGDQAQLRAALAILSGVGDGDGQLLEAYRTGVTCGVGIGQRALAFSSELAQLHMKSAIRMYGITSPVDVPPAGEVIECADRCYGCGAEDLAAGKFTARPRRVPMLYCAGCADDLRRLGVDVEVTK